MAKKSAPATIDLYKVEQLMNELLLLSSLVKEKSSRLKVLDREWSTALKSGDRNRIKSCSKNRKAAQRELSKLKKQLQSAKGNFWMCNDIYCDSLWKNYWGL